MSVFTDWVEAERRERGWSQNELARQANITSGMMSRVMVMGLKPGLKVCRGLAKAFDVSEQFILEKAGQLQKAELPECTEIDEYDRRILDVLCGMDEQFKATVLKTVKAWRFYEEHRIKNEDE